MFSEEVEEKFRNMREKFGLDGATVVGGVDLYLMYRDVIVPVEGEEDLLDSVLMLRLVLDSGMELYPVSRVLVKRGMESEGRRVRAFFNALLETLAIKNGMKYDIDEVVDLAIRTYEESLLGSMGETPERERDAFKACCLQVLLDRLTGLMWTPLRCQWTEELGHLLGSPISELRAERVLSFLTLLTGHRLLLQHDAKGPYIKILSA